jgi:hypothetical protein
MVRREDFFVLCTGSFGVFLSFEFYLAWVLFFH